MAAATLVVIIPLPTTGHYLSLIAAVWLNKASCILAFLVTAKRREQETVTKLPNLTANNFHRGKYTLIVGYDIKIFLSVFAYLQ